MSIGENLKKYRNEKKISQRKLSQASGVSFTYIQQLEKNKKQNPSIEIITKLSTALELEVKDLLGIQHEKERIENIEKHKTDILKVSKIIELNKKKDEGTATTEDMNLLQSFTKEDWINFAFYGLGNDALPPEAVSYMQFIKLIETLGYNPEDLKINKLSLFNKIKYQISLEINYSQENE